VTECVAELLLDVSDDLVCGRAVLDGSGPHGPDAVRTLGVEELDPDGELVAQGGSDSSRRDWCAVRFLGQRPRLPMGSVKCGVAATART